METLHPRIRYLWIVEALIIAAIIAIVIAVIDSQVEAMSGYVPIGVFAGIGVLGGIYAILLYDRWGYELQRDALYLERGVITFVETSVPYVRVQHVDTQFGPVERLLGLSSVVVYTAGSRNADVRIPGLTPDRARSLRNTLRELAIESDTDDAV